MKISILTLFPEMFTGPFDSSIIKRAIDKGSVEIEYINIRDFGIGKHRVVDDTPYGGGIGMVMRVDVIHKTVEHTKTRGTRGTLQKVVLMSAGGKPFKQTTAKEFAALDHLILICGHYEGIDERIKHFVDYDISIGDFVVTGGEIPVMLITDAVIRLIPGILKEGATNKESFSFGSDDQPLLEYPQYTKPQTYKNLPVPEVLLSGNHAEINKWREEGAIKKTAEIRPDLISNMKK